jgi:hypothetical protein
MHGASIPLTSTAVGSIGVGECCPGQHSLVSAVGSFGRQLSNYHSVIIDSGPWAFRHLRHCDNSPAAPMARAARFGGVDTREGEIGGEHERLRRYLCQWHKRRIAQGRIPGTSGTRASMWACASTTLFMPRA